jgi:hypothetical protein
MAEKAFPTSQLSEDGAIKSSSSVNSINLDLLFSLIITAI